MARAGDPAVRAGKICGAGGEMVTIDYEGNKFYGSICLKRQGKYILRRYSGREEEDWMTLPEAKKWLREKFGAIQNRPSRIEIQEGAVDYYVETPRGKIPAGKALPLIFKGLGL
ncbi:hypothetical protein [Thermosulfurimonas sp. F29]|uniref:hypothetical protein n=1 Tax=Thermosulfurimonas sp. F29 TaxID=2867247 RepID=UPI001C83B96B|nr:hypothetical protein [Thermosulfurimonas sp. F29]MBX6424157.1 hypothetical protein [Thermosulfurimonas sp. F29]